MTWKARTGSSAQSASSEVFNFSRATSAASDGSFGRIFCAHTCEISAREIGIARRTAHGNDAIQKQQAFIESAKPSAEFD